MLISAQNAHQFKPGNIPQQPPGTFVWVKFKSALTSLLEKSQMIHIMWIKNVFHCNLILANYCRNGKSKYKNNSGNVWVSVARSFFCDRTQPHDWHNFYFEGKPFSSLHLQVALHQQPWGTAVNQLGNTLATLATGDCVTPSVGDKSQAMCAWRHVRNINSLLMWLHAVVANTFDLCTEGLLFGIRRRRRLILSGSGPLMWVPKPRWMGGLYGERPFSIVCHILNTTQTF